jgi:hypothetical protein
MKKSMSLLALVLLSVCLMGFAFGRVGPGAQAAQAVLGSPVAQTPMVPAAVAVQQVALVVTALACVLFGLLAVAPLLLSEPAR